MPISALPILSTKSPYSNKVIHTLQLRFPKFILPEFNTHRVFTRNASSSRAIPVLRLIEDAIRETAMPVHWGKNQPGMSAREEHYEPIVYRGETLTAPAAWNRARDNAIEMAEAFAAAGYHKQIVNRLIETFTMVNVLVTSTEWDNFFELRDHPDAQPEILALAKEMKDAISNSVIIERDFHIPWIRPEEEDASLKEKTMISVARSARVSYKTFDGKLSKFEDDIALYEKLVGSEPLHASPAEHQAVADRATKNRLWDYPKLHGNFDGFIQFRKTLEISSKISAFTEIYY